MSLASSNPSLNRGSHFTVVVPVFRFAPAHVGQDWQIDFGPQIVCDRALLMHVIPLQNACLFQFGECGDDLLKGAIDDGPSFVNFSFGFVQFLQFIQLALFHSLYPIGNHVSQRIQAFSRDGKRGYLHSLGRKLTETQETKGLDSGLHGRHTGIGRAHISNLETGKKEAGLRALEILADSFGLSLPKLLSRI